MQTKKPRKGLSFDNLKEGQGYFCFGASKLFEADDDFVLAFVGDEFANEALEWAFHDFYGLAG